MTPDQIAKLPPELPLENGENLVHDELRKIYCCKGAEFCRPELQRAWLEIARLHRSGLQVVEERDREKAENTKDLNAAGIWRNKFAASEDFLKVAREKLQTAEATIATLTQDLSVAMETIHRMGCNTDDCAECAALSHTPEGGGQ